MEWTVMYSIIMSKDQWLFKFDYLSNWTFMFCFCYASLKEKMRNELIVCFTQGNVNWLSQTFGKFILFFSIILYVKIKFTLFIHFISTIHSIRLISHVNLVSISL